MGVAKSLRKAGHLQQLGEGLNDIGAILEANRKKKAQQEFINGVLGLYDKWKIGQTAAEQKDTVMQEGKTVNSVFSPENLKVNRVANLPGKHTVDPNDPEGRRIVTPDIGGERKPGFNLTIPESAQTNAPTDMIPEIKTRQTTPEEQYQKAQTNYGDFLEKVTPMLMSTDVGSEGIDKANVLTNLAKTQTEALKPKEKKIGTFNPEFDVVDENTGSIIRKGRQKEAKVDLEGSFKNPKTGTYWKYDDTNRAGVDTGIPYDKNENRSSTSIKIDKEGSLDKDTAKLIADLKNFKPYTVNDDGKQVPMLPEDIKYNKDKTLENIKLQLLSPRGYEFINNIEGLWRKGDPTGSKQYLSPTELFDETIKHAENGDIDEKTQDEIATYLKYYSNDIYKGLTK